MQTYSEDPAAFVQPKGCFLSCSELYGKAGGVPESRLTDLVAQLWPSLTDLHKKDLIYGMLSADHVYVDRSGVAHLEPRRFFAMKERINSDDLRGDNQSGFAAFEQYVDDPALTLGPWTDVYGLSALLRMLILGQTPPDAIQRRVDDTCAPLADMGLAAYTHDFLAAIDKGMALSVHARFQSVDDFAQALCLERGGKLGFAAGADATAGAAIAVDAGAVIVAGSTTGTSMADDANSPGDDLVSGPQAQSPPSSSIETTVAASRRRPVFARVALITLIAFAVGAYWFWPQHGPISTLSVASSGSTENSSVEIRSQPVATSSVAESESSPPPLSPSELEMLPSEISRPDIQQLTPGALQPEAKIPSSNLSQPEPGSVAAALTNTDNQIDAAKPVPFEPALDAAPIGSGMAASEVNPGGTETTPVSLQTDMAVVANPAARPKADSSEAGNGSPGLESTTNRSAIEAALLPKSDTVSEPGSGDGVGTNVKKPPVKEKERNNQKPARVAGVPIHLTIRPWGKVFVNGTPKGVTPPLKTLTLKPGQYRIRITNGDLPAYQQTLTVRAGQPSTVSHDFD